MTGTVLVSIYILMGMITLIYDWNKYHKEEYKRLKDKNEVEDSYAILYMLFVIVFWPFKVLQYII